MDRLTRSLLAVPIRKPIFGFMETTSGFGVRSDPFLRSPAMHTGLDLRGSTGDPVRATASGTVTSTGWNGGYGRMVEIDHGNGLSTRYAHLSAADVKEGQMVRAGQIDRPGRARPAARPARICTTRPASTARRSIRRSSCAPDFGSAPSWANRVMTFVIPFYLFV